MIYSMQRNLPNITAFAFCVDKRHLNTSPPLFSPPLRISLHARDRRHRHSPRTCAATQAARSQSPRNYTAKFREDDESKELELCTFQPNVSTTQAG